jgi:hypothetical protein
MESHCRKSRFYSLVICPKSNGKGLVSVGFQDCIIPLMEDLVEKTSSDALIQLGS